MINQKMSIDEIFSQFPHKAQRIAQELASAGLECAGCHGPTADSLEAAFYTSGFEEVKIQEVVERLNALLAEPDAPRDTITLTPRAAAKYQHILAEEGKSGWGIRFAEKAAGCNGFEYVLDYSPQPQEGDAIFVSQGIEIHVPQVMIERLRGSEIDFVDGLRGSGFKITNPNVKSCCGCGSSHGY